MIAAVGLGSKGVDAAAECLQRHGGARFHQRGRWARDRPGDAWSDTSVVSGGNGERERRGGGGEETGGAWSDKSGLSGGKGEREREEEEEERE